MAIRHSTPADNSFTPQGKAAWDAGHDGDASDIAFVPSGTGATSTNLQTRGRNWVLLTDYGDPTVDAGDSLQKCHNALGADGGTIIITAAASFYPVLTQAAFTKNIRLVGYGWYASELLTSVASLVMITHTKLLQIENVGFTAFSSAIATAVAVKTLSTATGHNFSGARNCYFSGFTKNWWAQRTTNHRFYDNKFVSNTGYNLYLENQTSADEGDTIISGNDFSGATGDTGILVLSTSDVQIVGNKFNTAAAVHIDIAPTTNAVGDFIITGNSIEGQTTAGVRLIATSGSITKSVITGNQFSGASATNVLVGAAAKNTVINGNTFNDTNAANGIGIDIQVGAFSTTIVGNQFHQILTAIKSDGSISGQTIKDNRFYLRSSGSANVTNFYLGGENDQNLSGMNSEKDIECDRYITNTSNAVYVNAFQLKGNCMLEVFVTGIVQGSAANAMKYRKVLVTNDGATITDLIALVSPAGTFDLQIVSSGGFTVVGIKRNGATGTSIDAMVRARVTGYVRDFSKV